MGTPSVLLVDVNAPYDQALVSWCRANDVEPVQITGEIPSLSRHFGFALCVFALSGQNKEGYERVRALAKMLRICPIVVLAEKTGIELAIRLIRLGIAEVIELPALVKDVVAKAVRHFADFGEPAETGELVGQSPPMRELAPADAMMAPTRLGWGRLVSVAMARRRIARGYDRGRPVTATSASSAVHPPPRPARRAVRRSAASRTRRSSRRRARRGSSAGS